MQHLNVTPELDEAPWGEDWRGAVEGKMRIAGLSAGMTSGAPSVMIGVELPDGTKVIAQTSLKLLLVAAAALVARHGDPRLEQPVDPNLH